MNTSWKISLLSVLILIVLTVFAGEAMARAGGGQSYGGSRSSGNGGGGDGLGILIYLLLRLCIEQPCIGIPLVIIIIIVAIIAKKRKEKAQYSRIQQAGNRNLAQKQTPAAMQKALADLTSRDPGFQGSEFTSKAVKAFMEIQEAWCGHDLSKVKRFISDGVHERFSLQIHMQKEQGIRNTMENISVHGCEIVSVQSDRHFDTVHVKITASARDSDVDLKTGRKIRDNYSGTFVEYWSFLRKPGVQTLEGKGLVEGVCPNCGAALTLSESGHCEYCDAVVTSGEYDWVLSEITQSSEWSTASSPSAVPGYAEISAADPGFNIQTIEDTASVAFWRYIKSYFDSSSAPMAKVATEGYAKALGESIGQTVQGEWHLYFHDAAVGAVEVQRIEQGTEFDRVDVLVKWSAGNGWINGNGKTRAAGPKTIRPQIFSFARKHGVLTRASQGLHSAHCPGCGAPYTGSDGGECEYCGRPLNDGSGSWVLEAVKPFTGARVNSVSVSPVTGAAGVTPDILLMSMAGVMYSDGKLDPEEMSMLSSFASHRGISEQTLQEIINSVQDPESPMPTPSNTTEAMEILKAMVRMSLADGRLDPSEKALLEKFATDAGLSRNVVASTIARQRKILYKQAKKAGE